MIQSEQTINIDAAIDEVWAFTSDMGKWASFMPGCRSYDIVDDRNSCWTLKVGVGALVRTVRVLVHIDQWVGPERVTFSFALQGDPVKGSGSYIATKSTQSSTELVLTLHVEGDGPMAPIWEAMSRPLLPQMIRSFCEKLKKEIERAIASRDVGVSCPPDNPSTIVSAVHIAVQPRLWRRVFSSCAKLFDR